MQAVGMKAVTEKE